MLKNLENEANKKVIAGITVAAIPAEFEVGVDGKVRRLGLSYEPSIGNDLIQFDENLQRTAYDR